MFLVMTFFQSREKQVFKIVMNEIRQVKNNLNKLLTNKEETKK